MQPAGLFTSSTSMNQTVTVIDINELVYSGLQNPRHLRNSPLFRPRLYKQLVLVD